MTTTSPPEPTSQIPELPLIIVIGDPTILRADQYARLVTILGDIVRANGGLGVERVSSETIIIPRH